MEGTKVTIPKLKGEENYKEQKLNTSFAIEAAGILDQVTRSITKLKAPTGAAEEDPVKILAYRTLLLAWGKDEGKAKQLIFSIYSETV